MSGTATGLVGIAVLFMLLALRIPVAFAMFVVGFFGIVALDSTTIGFPPDRSRTASRAPPRLRARVGSPDPLKVATSTPSQSTVSRSRTSCSVGT